MKKMLLVAILSLMANAEAVTVNELKRTDRVSQHDYMMGVIDGAMAMGAQCGFGVDATCAQDIEVMNKYIANNPEEWGDNVGVVYLKAIIQAYHCMAPESPKNMTEVRW